MSQGNPIVYGGVASPQGVYEPSAVQYHRVGQRGFLADRVFYYTRVTGTSVATNTLAGPAALVANHINQTGTLTGFVAGSRQFTAVLGATLADSNQYSDGYIRIRSATTGAGQIMKLQDHGAVASAGTAVFNLYDTIITTTTGTTTWSLVRNPWADVVVYPTAAIGPAVGSTLVATGTGTVAAPVFVWLQSWGPASVLADATALLAGSGVVGSTTTAGSIGVETAAGITQRVGVAQETLTSATHQAVFLTIAP